MKKPLTFASAIRLKAALCCSVAVLLTACGGMADESANQQLLADTVVSETVVAANAGATGAVDTLPATPETVAQETAAPAVPAPAAYGSAAPAMPDPSIAPTDSADVTAAPASQSGGASAPASSEFSLNGYQDTAASSDAASEGTVAAAGADGQQAAQLPTP